jgi:hypothetical protein
MNEEEFQKVLAELTEAEIVHAAAVEVEHAASRKTTSALDRLNDAQKAFDAAVDAKRNAALWNTNWHSQRNRGEIAA